MSKTKTAFVMNVHIGAMIAENGLDLPKLVNSVKSALSDDSLKVTQEAVKRGDVKIGTFVDDDGKQEKNGGFSYPETETTLVSGKLTYPSQFASWHDAMASLWRKQGQPSGVMTLAVVPQGLRDWLVTKFSIGGAPNGNEGKPKGEGKPGKDKSKDKSKDTPVDPALESIRREITPPVKA